MPSARPRRTRRHGPHGMATQAGGTQCGRRALPRGAAPAASHDGRRRSSPCRMPAGPGAPPPRSSSIAFSTTVESSFFTSMTFLLLLPMKRMIVEPRLRLFAWKSSGSGGASGAAATLAMGERQIEVDPGQLTVLGDGSGILLPGDPDEHTTAPVSIVLNTALPRPAHGCPPEQAGANRGRPRTGPASRTRAGRALLFCNGG
mgnify:CR=1 FL=1